MLALAIQARGPLDIHAVNVSDCFGLFAQQNEADIPKDLRFVKEEVGQTSVAQWGRISKMCRTNLVKGVLGRGVRGTVVCMMEENNLQRPPPSSLALVQGDKSNCRTNYDGNDGDDDLVRHARRRSSHDEVQKNYELF